ncbi:MAG: hypothetical protein KF795_26875 [Labilithrix sp.]|nr:hypothetical protein [Labilithrix sp.]
MSSSVCPFCKSAVSDPRGPCPSCGRQPSGPSAGPSDWGDDDLGGGLDLSRGGSMASHATGPSAYAGGGIGFGDDDDPFADDVPQGALELDLPPSHTANTPRSMPVESPRSAAAAPLSAPGSAPELSLPPPSQPRLGASMPAPRSDPSMPAPRHASDPSMPAPPRSDPSMPPRHASDPSMPAPRSDPSMSAPHVAGYVAAAAPPDPAAMIARFPPPPAKVWEAPIYAMKVLWRQLELRQDLASLRKRRSPDVALYERALRTHDTKTFAVGLAITCAGLAIASFVFFLPVILRFLRDPD